MTGFHFRFRKYDDWSSGYWRCHNIFSRTSCTGLPGVADVSGAHNGVIIAAACAFMTRDVRL